MCKHKDWIFIKTIGFNLWFEPKQCTMCHRRLQHRKIGRKKGMKLCRIQEEDMG